MVKIIFAQTNLGPEFGSPWGQTLQLADLVQIVLSTGISAGGVIVLFMFIFSGWRIIRGARNDDPKATAEGRTAITYAVIGLVVVLGAYSIVRVIEIVTGNTFLTNPFATTSPGLPDTGR